MDNNYASPIAVLGAGAWGAAMAVLLARNGQAVRLWDHDTKRLSMMQSERALLGVALPESLKIELDLEDAVRDVTDICLVVPSHAFRAVLTRLKTMVPPTVRVMWGTKGLDPDTAGFLHQIVYEVFSPKTPIAILSGPSFAKEVILNLPTAVSLAGNDRDFLDSLVQRFHNAYFHVYLNSDFIGVQLCGVVKNVMAIAVGISDGMGFGSNTRCALITRGLSEMSRLCVVLGGLPETAMSLAGVGDLILTCTDNQSRNRRFGLAVGQGASAEKALADIGESVEGYYNAKQLYQLAQKYKVLMPIAEQVYAVLYENRSTQTVLSELLARESGNE
ncbi:MAG: NAD(P)-dependent glycerol-3-phosphate dehydrogenase [Gammaproteobacteria bacterium]|nr:NAD(P)-dependent glycerol-3-phosphate dehydrogenase [Gammaproteobacteria bacterium]